MSKAWRKFWLLVALLIVTSLTFPLPARADGGPMVDPTLFAKLKEGQQVAVITLRPHKTLANPYPRTPAMASGIANHVWTVEEIVKLI